MTAYEKLRAVEPYAHTVEVREKSTGKSGVANSYDFYRRTFRPEHYETPVDAVLIFIGADDGSDDRIIPADEFSRDFEITAIVE